LVLFGIWDLGFGILIPAYIAFSYLFVAQRAMNVSCENNSSSLNSKSQASNTKHCLEFGIWDLGFGILIPAYIAFSYLFVTEGHECFM